MATRTARPAVDLAPQTPARPRLAMARALLSIPRVTAAVLCDALADAAALGLLAPPHDRPADEEQR